MEAKMTETTNPIEPTRGDNVVPITRGGLSQAEKTIRLTQGRAIGGTTLERNAPRFQNEKEFKQWLEGKPTRIELRDDFARQQKGLALLTALNAEIDSKFEALVRLLCEKGIIDQAAFLDRAKLQLEFKRMLDGVNFADGYTMKDKIVCIMDWNEAHPELPVHGGYVRGLTDYLLANPDSDTPEHLAEVAMAVLLDPEEVLNDETKAALAMSPEDEAKLDAEIKATIEAAKARTPEQVEADLKAATDEATKFDAEILAEAEREAAKARQEKENGTAKD
jgi:hypothetical protein